MAMTSRAKKRLALALVVILVGGVAIPGAYLLRRAQKSQSVELALEEGLAAHANEDHATAIKRLRYYVSSRRDNNEANLALAQSLSVAAATNPGLLLQAVDHAVRVTSGEYQLEARSLVLDLYSRAGKLSETLQAATRVTDLDPENYDALSARTAVLLALPRWDDATQASSDFREAYPDDLDAQTLYFHIQLSLPANSRPDPASLRSELDRVYQANAEDLRFGLMRFDFLMRMQLIEPAIAALRESLEVGDIALVMPDQLRYWSKPVHRLANLAQNDEIRQEARKARDTLFALAADVPELRQTAALELAVDAWANGRAADARPYFKSAVSPVESASIDALGWALLLGVEDETIEDQLNERVGVAAEFWKDLSQVPTLVDAGRFDEAETLLKALGSQGEHAWLTLHMQGQARLNRGDALAASVAFEESIRRSPHGPSYLTAARLAEAYFGAGLYRRSLDVATDAVTLAGDGRVSEVLPKSVALLASAGMISQEYRDRLISALSANQDQAGVSSTGLTHITSMYLALGRADLAIDAATRALEVATDDDAGALAEASRLMLSADPSLADRLLEEAAARDARHPSVILTTASMLALSGDPAAGEALFQQEIGDADDARLVRLRETRNRFLAQFLPEVLEGEIAQLAEDQPDNANAQLSALGTNALWTDRDASRRSIDRLKTLLGEEGMAWRTHEARWILSFTPENAASIRTDVLAPLLASDSPDSRVLILAAEARLRESQAASATEQESRLWLGETIALYERASAGEQPMPAIALRSIRMLQELGRTSEAESRLRSLSSLGTLTATQRRTVARLYEAQGLFHEAAESLAATVGDSPSSSLLSEVARLWARAGENQRARDAFARAVADDTAPWNVVVEAASYHTAIGETDLAESLLSELGARVDASIGMRARAEYLARIGEVDQAEAILIGLAQTDGQYAAILGEFYASRGRADEFDAAIRDALARFPDAPELLALQDLRAQTIAGTRGDLPAAVSAVARVLSDHQSKTINANQALARLTGIIARFPSSKPARVQLVRFLRDEGRIDEALDAAGQLVIHNPSDPSAARFAAAIAIEANDLRSALGFAREWRRRSMPNTAESEKRIASIQLDLGQAPDALAWAEANQERAVSRASLVAEWPDVSLVVQILFAVDRESQAREILDRLANADPSWALESLDWIPAARASADAQRSWIVWVQQTAQPAPEASLRLAELWYLSATQTNESIDFQRVVDLLKDMEQSTLDTDNCARLGASYSSLGDLNSAAHWYDAAIEKNSDNPNPLILNNAVYVDYQLGQIDEESLARIETSIGLLQQRPFQNSTLASLLDTKGLVQLSLGRDEAALASYEQALALPLASPKIDLWVGQAQALLSLGRLDEARTAIDSLPNGPINAELQARIDGLKKQL